MIAGSRGRAKEAEETLQIVHINFEKYFVSRVVSKRAYRLLLFYTNLYTKVGLCKFTNQA